jgi:hypothetical protein
VQLVIAGEQPKGLSQIGQKTTDLFVRPA